MPYHTNVVSIARSNEDFRRVLFTGDHPFRLFLVAQHVGVPAAVAVIDREGVTGEHPLAVASAHPRKDAGGNLTVAAEEAASYAAAKPAFEKHCFRCHTKAGAKAKRKTLEHLSMDGYPFGGHHADEIGAAVRRTLGIGTNAKSPTMPKDDPGVVRGDDLARILAWKTEAFDRARTQPKRLQWR